MSPLAAHPPRPGDPGPLTVHQQLIWGAPAYLRRYGWAIPARQRTVLLRLLRCRTAALGGQIYQCPGGHRDYQYHSCNDRHCPRCGQADADDWLARQRARLLLPAPYFLVTFTVPEPLRAFLRAHAQLGLDLLFACSAQALQDLAGHPKHLGAQLGMLGVLHTWSRTLSYHPHIHFLVPGGGLTPDGRAWRASRPGFLLPIKPLGLRVKTLFAERLRAAHPELFAQIPAKVWGRHWNVDSRAAGSGENALRYLARYVFKTATGNRPVPTLPDGRLQWTYTDSRTGRPARVALTAEEFLRRFLQHVLPKHFARVRTFGWLHPAAKGRGNRVRALLGVPAVLSAAEQAAWRATAPEGTAAPAAPASSAPPARRCPHCDRPMTLYATWRPGRPLTRLAAARRAAPTAAG